MKPPEAKVIRIGLDRETDLWAAHCTPCRLSLSSTYSKDVFEDMDRHVAAVGHHVRVLLWRHGLERAA